MISMTSLVRVCGIASLSALSITTYLNLPSYAQSTTFFCGNNKGTPVTYARTPDAPPLRQLVPAVAPSLAEVDYPAKEATFVSFVPRSPWLEWLAKG